MKDKGSTTLEFIVAFPFFLLLFLSIVQLSLIWSAKNMLSFASFVAGRTVSIYPSDLERAKKYVKTVMIPFMGIRDVSPHPVEFKVFKGEKEVNSLKSEEEFTLSIKFRYRLFIPFVNSLLGKWDPLYGYYIELSEKRKWFVEPCPGWEKGECVSLKE